MTVWFPEKQSLSKAESEFLSAKRLSRYKLCSTQQLDLPPLCLPDLYSHFFSGTPRPAAKCSSLPPSYFRSPDRPPPSSQRKSMLLCLQQLNQR